MHPLQENVLVLTKLTTQIDQKTSYCPISEQGNQGHCLKTAAEAGSKFTSLKRAQIFFLLHEVSEGKTGKSCEDCNYLGNWGSTEAKEQVPCK